MEAGGCLKEFLAAGSSCNDATNKSSGDVKSCVKATAALRRCMMANEAFFKQHIRALDRGLEENERLGYGILTEEYGHGVWLPKCRWWNSMRRK